MINKIQNVSSTNLSDIDVGNFAKIIEVCEPGYEGERLLEMGLTKGTKVQMIRQSLLGSPIQLIVRHYVLSIRKLQASNIRVQKIKG